MSAFLEAKKDKRLRDMAKAKCPNLPPEACIARYHIFNDVSSSRLLSSSYDRIAPLSFD